MCELWGHYHYFYIVQTTFYRPRPTLSLNPHSKLCTVFLYEIKTHFVWFMSLLINEDISDVFIIHYRLVISVSYLCRYTHLCPDVTTIHTHTHTVNCRWVNVFFTNPCFLLFIFVFLKGRPARHQSGSSISCTKSDLQHRHGTVHVCIWPFLCLTLFLLFIWNASFVVILIFHLHVHCLHVNTIKLCSWDKPSFKMFGVSKLQ